MKVLSNKNLFTLSIFTLMLLMMPIVQGCKEEVPKPQKVEDKFAVININELLKTHPDWNKLENINKHLEKIEKEMSMGSSASLEKLGEQQATRMEQARMQAKQELEAQLAQLKHSMEQQRNEVSRQLQQEAKVASAKMKQLRGSGSSQLTNARDKGRDLIALRDRQVTAKRLELQKQAKEKIDALYAQYDRELIDYGVKIAKESQNQRLNIQLKLQLNPPEEERKKLLAEMDELTSKEAELKAKKRQEQAELIAKARRDEAILIDKEVAAYRNKVDSDLKTQLGVGKNGSLRSGSELQRESQKVVVSFEKKQKQLEASLAGASAQSQAQIQAKQAQLEKRLKELQSGMIKEMARSRDKLIKEDLERVNKLREEHDSILEQKNKLYSSMVEDLKVDIWKIAKEKGYTMIFISYISNVECPDITSELAKSLRKK